MDGGAGTEGDALAAAAADDRGVAALLEIRVQPLLDSFSVGADPFGEGADGYAGGAAGLPGFLVVEPGGSGDVQVDPGSFAYEFF